jgi:hypothetical protein
MKTQRIKLSNKNTIHRLTTTTSFEDSTSSSSTKRLGRPATPTKQVSKGDTTNTNSSHRLIDKPSTRSTYTTSHRLKLGKTNKASDTRSPYRAIITRDNFDIDEYLADSQADDMLSVANNDDRVPRKPDKAVRQSPGEAQATSLSATVQHTKQVTPPTLVAIHKLEFSVQVNAYELVATVARARDLARSKVLTHRTSKSAWYKHLFVLRFASGASAVFLMEPTQPNVKTLIQLHINPNHLSTADAKKLIEVWRALFLDDARRLAHTLLFRRIDVCADFPYSVDDLVLNIDGARTGAVVFVQTGLGGRIQTFYAGSIEAAKNGTAYDQNASDTHKVSVGELPSTTRKKMKDDCELGLTTTKDRVRIESRNHFKTPLSYSELPALGAPFAGFKVYIKRPDRVRKPALEYLAYLDSVSLRGIYGARLHLTRDSAHVREARATIGRFEVQLIRDTAPWWQPQDFNASVVALLKTAPIWKFLCVLARP